MDEKAKAYRRAYWQAHKEEINAKRREEYRNDPAVRDWWRKRHAADYQKRKAASKA